MNEEKLSKLSEYINLDEALPRVMNMKNLYKKLLTSYKNNSFIDQITKDAESGDFEAAASSAHAIKGVSANLAFPKINDLSTKLEALYKNNTSSPDLLAQLQEATATTLEYVDHLLETL